MGAGIPEANQRQQSRSPVFECSVPTSCRRGAQCFAQVRYTLRQRASRIRVLLVGTRAKSIFFHAHDSTAGTMSGSGPTHVHFQTSVVRKTDTGNR